MNPYEYKISLRNEKMRELYDRFKRWKGIPIWCPLSDNERLEFENYILKSNTNYNENRR